MVGRSKLHRLLLSEAGDRVAFLAVTPQGFAMANPIRMRLATRRKTRKATVADRLSLQLVEVPLCKRDELRNARLRIRTWMNLHRFIEC